MGRAEAHSARGGDGGGPRQARRDPRRPEGGTHKRPCHGRADDESGAQRRGPGLTSGVGAGPVLVTGGAGFIGGYVTRELVDLGRTVTVLTRGRSKTPDMDVALRDHVRRFATEIGSVEDLAALIATFERVRPATVVHSASNVGVPKRL